MSDPTTKESLLDAAQHLFSSQGFASTSLRAIIKEAGVNTAAIHYHFGSREGLIEAVLQRHAAPVNARRIELLDRHEALHPSGPLPVEGIVRAFLEPVQELVRDAQHGTTLPRLLGRATMESDSTLRPIVARIFRDVAGRFMAAFRRALPDLPREVTMWRVHFMLGAMVFTLNVPLARMSDDGVEFVREPLEMGFEPLVEFVTAGLGAPATAGTRKEDP